MRRASHKVNAAATEILKLSTKPDIGIATHASAACTASSVTPWSSFPKIIAVGFDQSISDGATASARRWVMTT
ncbi:hypothetical protein NADE_008187 [Nannochloris sp. 'desiccata']|nr:hypothetical protein NADE_008187 [Chlorella desiccata (nom. nud.)]